MGIIKEEGMLLWWTASRPAASSLYWCPIVSNHCPAQVFYSDSKDSEIVQNQIKVIIFPWEKIAFMYTIEKNEIICDMTNTL